MKRLEKNTNKILNTKLLLQEIITLPVSFKDHTTLILALKSQRKLAQYQNQDRDIESCSLNTFKDTSNKLLDRGFIEINELRIHAKDAIEIALVENKPSKKTKTGLKYMVDKLEEKNNILQQNNFLLNVIVNDLRDELKKMSESTDNIENRQVKYQYLNRTIEAKLNYALYGII